MVQGFKNKRSAPVVARPKGGPKKGARHIPAKKATAVAQARIEKQVGSAHRVRVESAMLARAKGALGSGGGGGGSGSLGAFKVVQTLASQSGALAAGAAAKERRSVVSERKSRRAQEAAVAEQEHSK